MSGTDRNVRTLFEAAARRARDADLSVADLISMVERLRALGDDASGRELYRLWTEHNEGNPLIHAVLFNYGVLLSDAGDLPAAREAYERACAAQPGFLAARINLGSVKERLGDRLAAVGEWYAAAQAQIDLTGDTLGWKVAAWKQAGRVLESAKCEEASENALHK